MAWFGNQIENDLCPAKNRSLELVTNLSRDPLLFTEDDSIPPDITPSDYGHPSWYIFTNFDNSVRYTSRWITEVTKLD
jgi:hypothetical protein